MDSFDDDSDGGWGRGISLQPRAAASFSASSSCVSISPTMFNSTKPTNSKGKRRSAAPLRLQISTHIDGMCTVSPSPAQAGTTSFPLLHAPPAPSLPPRSNHSTSHGHSRSSSRGRSERRVRALSSSAGSEAPTLTADAVGQPLRSTAGPGAGAGAGLAGSRSAAEPPVLAGYLWKLNTEADADGYCHWQKLWFQLQHGMLLQYLTAGEADARARKRPAGIIQVDGVTAIMRVANGTMLPSTDQTVKHCFAVHIRQRRQYLQAASNGEAQRWMQALFQERCSNDSLLPHGVDKNSAQSEWQEHTSMHGHIVRFNTATFESEVVQRSRTRGSVASDTSSASRSRAAANSAQCSDSKEDQDMRESAPVMTLAALDAAARVGAPPRPPALERGHSTEERLHELQALQEAAAAAVLNSIGAPLVTPRVTAGGISSNGVAATPKRTYSTSTLGSDTVVASNGTLLASDLSAQHSSCSHDVLQQVVSAKGSVIGGASDTSGRFPTASISTASTSSNAWSSSTGSTRGTVPMVLALMMNVLQQPDRSWAASRRNLYSSPRALVKSFHGSSRFGSDIVEEGDEDGEEEEEAADGKHADDSTAAHADAGAGAGAGAARPRTGGSTTSSAASTVLPDVNAVDVWLELWDDEYGWPYYVNVATQAAQWSWPSDESAHVVHWEDKTHNAKAKTKPNTVKTKKKKEKKEKKQSKQQQQPHSATAAAAGSRATSAGSTTSSKASAHSASSGDSNQSATRRPGKVMVKRGSRRNVQRSVQPPPSSMEVVAGPTTGHRSVGHGSDSKYLDDYDTASKPSSGRLPGNHAGASTHHAGLHAAMASIGGSAGSCVSTDLEDNEEV